MATAKSIVIESLTAIISPFFVGVVVLLHDCRQTTCRIAIGKFNPYCVEYGAI